MHRGLAASTPATAYVVVDAHRLDDMRPYLFKTTDYGKTWKSLSAGLPPDVYLHAVREDPKKKGLLYVGTERGVMFSRDDGATWEPLTAEPADGRRSRPRGQGRRPRRRHARPVDLDPRRPDGSPRDVAGVEGQARPPVPGRARHRLALPRLLPRGRAGRQPSGRSRGAVLAQGEAPGRRDARGLRREGDAGPQAHQRGGQDRSPSRRSRRGPRLEEEAAAHRRSGREPGAVEPHVGRGHEDQERQDRHR